MRCSNMGIIVQSVLGVILFVQRGIRCDGTVDPSIIQLQADSQGYLFIYYRTSSWPNINVKSLPINSLKHLDVSSGVNFIWDGTEPVFLEHLQKIQFDDGCKVNPHSLLFSDNLKTLSIFNTEIINGTLGDLLKTANNLQTLTITGMDDTNISELLSNHSMNQSPHSNTAFSNLVELQLRFSNLKNNRTSDLLNVFVNLKKVLIYSCGDIDVSRINQSNYLNAAEGYFGKELVSLTLGNTPLVNGNLDSFFKLTRNVEELYLNDMGDVDISGMPYSKLRRLQLWHCNLKWSRKIRFEELALIDISRSTMSDMKPFFEFNEWFPHVPEISTGQKLIVPPKAILGMINSSLTKMRFSFDCNPPIKSYEFGEAMKFMSGAGFIHNHDANAPEERAEINWRDVFGHVYASVSASKWRQRIHYVWFKKLAFENDSFKWTTSQNDFSFSDLREIPELNVKSEQTKSLIHIYFVLVSTLLFFGITGNSLSALVLIMKNPKHSAGIILLGLTFFDFLVILTYVIAALQNAELFHDMFLKPGLKSNLYSVDEHLWMAEQNRFQALIIYPLNKTAYTGSVYMTILISLERFIAICWPLKSKELLRSRNSKLAILTILAFSVLLNILRWIESQEWSYYLDDSPYWNDFYKPTLMRMKTYRILYHGSIWTCFMYIIPFVLVGFFNFKILIHLKQTKEERRSMQSTGSSTAEKQTKDAEMMSVTKMLLCVVAVFVLCNFLHIAIVFYFIMNYDEIQLSRIEAVSCLPIIVNCSVNFIIYIYFGKTLRAEFLKLIPRWVYSCISCCKRGQSNNIELSVIEQQNTRL